MIIQIVIATVTAIAELRCTVYYSLWLIFIIDFVICFFFCDRMIMIIMEIIMDKKKRKMIAMYVLVILFFVFIINTQQYTILQTRTFFV